MSHDAVPSFTKIYEKPKQEIAEILKLDESLHHVAERVTMRRSRVGGKSLTKKWFAMPISELHSKERDLDMSSVIKGIYLPEYKHVYGTKKCLP